MHGSLLLFCTEMVARTARASGRTLGGATGRGLARHVPGGPLYPAWSTEQPLVWRGGDNRSSCLSAFRGHKISGHAALGLAALPGERFEHLRGGTGATIFRALRRPEWRNGRRNGLKIRRGQPHESSTLSSGIFPCSTASR